MPGIVTDPIAYDPKRDSLDATPSSLWGSVGAAFSEGFQHGPSGDISRVLEAIPDSRAPGVYDGHGNQLPAGTAMPAPTPGRGSPYQEVLSADDANHLYGIPGVLHFDGNTDKSVAEARHQWATEEQARQSVLAREPTGLLPSISRGVAGFAAGAADPLGVAASVLPGVGETRVAAWAAGLTDRAIGGVAGKIAGKALTGAVTAPAAVAPLAGVQLALSGKPGADDYHAVDALQDIALGSLLGGGLHAGGALLGHVFGAPDEHGISAAAEPGPLLDNPPPEAVHAAGIDAAMAGPEAQAVSEGVSALPIEGREAMLQGAVGSLMDTGEVNNIDRVALEQEQLGRAYDDVHANPQGPADDPLVHIQPEDIQGAIISRGGFKGIGDATIKKSGWGLAKFIWRHGEESGDPPQFQVSRDDVLAFPQVIRDFEPSRPAGNGQGREWRVQLPGPDGTPRTVVYADNMLTGKPDHPRLVTIHIQDPSRPGGSDALSANRSGGAGSLGRTVGGPPEDTAASIVKKSAEPTPPANNTVAHPSRLVEVDPSTVGVDAKTFQFKDGGDASGVTDRLQGVDRWHPERAGVSLMYEDHEGKLWVADGHQRLGLAKRLQAEGQNVKLNAHILRASDGVTPEEAMVTAALKNIAEGSGSAVDAAKVIRAIGDNPALADRFGRDTRSLPPTSPLVRDGKALAGLGPDGWGMVVNGHVTPETAAEVARVLPDPAEQTAALKIAADAKPTTRQQARLLAEQVRDAGFAAREEGRQADMFGPATMKHALVVERSRVLDAALRSLRRDRATFKALTERADVITGAGANVLDTATNSERADADGRLLDVLTRLAQRRGPLGDALGTAAADLHAGHKLGEVTGRFVDAAKRAIREGGLDGAAAGDLGSPHEGGGGGADTDTAGRGSQDAGGTPSNRQAGTGIANPVRLGASDGEVSSAADTAARAAPATPQADLQRLTADAEAAEARLRDQAGYGQLAIGDQADLVTLKAESDRAEASASVAEAAAACIQRSLF